jgi:hypothetical protein
MSKNHLKWVLVVLPIMASMWEMGGKWEMDVGNEDLGKWEGDQQCLRGNGKNGVLVLEWEWEETRGWIFAFWQGRHWRTCGTSKNGKN